MALRVLAVLAGGTPSYQSLGGLYQWCDVVYAADSGQEVCVANGFKPHVVVGDLDSVGERLEGVEYRERQDQDYSDCDKVLAEIELLGDIDLVMAGLEGDRFDHVLSSLSSVVRSGLNPRILFQQGYGQVVRAESSVTIEGWKGFGFSMIGLGDAVVSTRGAKWEVDSAMVSFGKGFSLSNVVESEVMEVAVHDGVALVILDSGIVNWEG